MINGTSKELVGVYYNNTPINSIYKDSKLIWCKPSKQPINEFIFDVEISYRYFYIPITPVGAEAMTGIVDWGDGKIEEITSEGSVMGFSKSHYYSSLGTYRVKFTLTGGGYDISDNMANNDTNRITKIISFGDQYNTSFSFQKANKIISFPSNYPFRNGTFRLYKDECEGAVNFDGLFSNTDTLGAIQECSFTRIEGDMFKGNENISYISGGIYNNTNLEYIENLYLPNLDSAYQVTKGCNKLNTIKTVTIPTNHSSYNMGTILVGSSNSSLRDMTVLNLSDYKRYSLISFQGLSNWGVNSTSCPNARQSLVDSLLTNTADKSGESKAMSIYLSDNSKAALTDEEKAQITSKGYTIV